MEKTPRKRSRKAQLAELSAEKKRRREEVKDADYVEENSPTEQMDVPHGENLQVLPGVPARREADSSRQRRHREELRGLCKQAGAMAMHLESSARHLRCGRPEWS